jgi:hypothetical protein
MAKWGNSGLGTYDHLDFDRVKNHYMLIEKFEIKSKKVQ